jgi:hypothetical protein
MLKALGPNLAAETIWTATDSSPQGELARIFEATPHIHKWPHYFPVYESVLGPLQDRPIKLLEIGVFRGGSLQMWRQYLHRDSTIVGIDIDEECEQFDDPARKIHVRIGAQEDTLVLERVVDEFGPFDVILDDGSHRNGHIIDSFKYLFVKGLADPGSYIVEDIHANYWTNWRDRRMSFVDFTKWLLDAMHAHYHVTDRETAFRIGDPTRLAQVTVPVATTLIDNVSFFDSIAVITRRKREMPRSVLNGAGVPCRTR